MKRYDRWEDVSLRLSHSYCRYKGRAVSVAVPEAGWNVILKDHLSDIKYEVDPNNEELDISAPELGWVNDKKRGPSFIYRLPYRVQTQGVSIRLLRAYWPGSDEKTNYLNDKSVSRLINHEYPSFEEVRGEIGAWSHKLALAKPYGVHVVCYQGNIAGVYNAKENSVRLTKNFNNKFVTRELSPVMRIENATS